MVEHGGLDIVCLNTKCRHGSSSSSTPEKGKGRFSRLKLKLTEHYPKKNAEILSAQYGTNVLLFGMALMLAASYQSHSVKEEHLFSFITTVMLLQLLWMLWYIVRKDRQKTSEWEKDAHAGTRWLRGGLTILAVLSLIMDTFRIGQYVSYKDCVSAALVVYPVVHTLHTISQVHFLWFHIKDVIKTFETFERFGVMHAVFTNLLLWCNGVMSESKHFLSSHNRRLSALGFVNHTEEWEAKNCNCSSTACTVFSNSLYYLYPFNIEYHILVSAMLFVMWKNIGRTIDHQHDKKRPITRPAVLVVGPILGLVALAGTISVLVIYIIDFEEVVEFQESDNIMFLSHGIIMLVCMCGASTVGLLIYRADNLPLDSSKIPSRQLDTVLLFGSSVGSWLMAWCSIVASAANRTNWISLAYSMLLVLEKYVQNVFIIESLYRKEDVAEEPEVAPPAATEIFSVTLSHVPACNGIINRAYENQDITCVTTEIEEEEDGGVYDCPPPPPEEPVSVAPSRPETLSRKRQLLKNITLFLFLCNISLWLLPAFGCRPQYESIPEQETFGYIIWTMVLNFAMPLTLFYRMHSVASLFEVFQKV
ncbi:proton channel OTOP1-like [Megalops cyprinoides]|uniref:proton channel OTOP1-like n=1 Tax=Megalops cyprinoides TaxID=118141 RepID=UPI001864E000|nr:proton channel OTOP1-like [Megalops cyprinoides]